MGRIAFAEWTLEFVLQDLQAVSVSGGAFCTCCNVMVACWYVVDWKIELDRQLKMLGRFD